ncbi:MAG: hypothetical protein HYV53_00205 [Parcubacteria group bacterium]|nr:hypothetical protein [Parcubacteria group bacterium]
MEKGLLEETVNKLLQFVDRVSSELTSLFSIGRSMSSQERLVRVEQFLTLAQVILSLEEKFFLLREIVERTEEKRENFLKALREAKPSMPPRTAKKWHG